MVTNAGAGGQGSGPKHRHKGTKETPGKCWRVPCRAAPIASPPIGNGHCGLLRKRTCARWDVVRLQGC